MELLKNLSIRTKLILVSVIPSLGLIFFLYHSLNNSIERKNDTFELYKNCEQTEKLSALLHAFQQERGYHLRFIASQRVQDRQKITEQIMKTNQALAEAQGLYAALNEETDLFLHLDSLDIFREDISTYPKKLNRMKSLLLQEIFLVTKGAHHDPELQNRLEAHLFLLHTKETFSRTKDILVTFFIEKTFHGSEFAEFAALKGQYEINREKFLVNAPKDLHEFYKRASSEEVNYEVHGLLDSIFFNPGAVSKMSGGEWWDKTALVINMQAETEKYSLQEIREKAGAQLVAINRYVSLNIISGVLILLLIGALVMVTIQHILFAVAELKRAAQKLALGEVDFAVRHPITRRNR